MSLTRSILLSLIGLLSFSIFAKTQDILIKNATVITSTDLGVLEETDVEHAAHVRERKLRQREHLQLVARRVAVRRAACGEQGGSHARDLTHVELLLGVGAQHEQK